MNCKSAFFSICAEHVQDELSRPVNLKDSTAAPSGRAYEECPDFLGSEFSSRG